MQQAADYVNKYHRHHKASVGCKFSIAVADDNEIHGVAICGRPVSRHYDDGFTLEIYRVCTDGTKNACSMLYGACCRIAKNMGYCDIYTYTLVSEDGASLKASNFINEGEAGGTHWTGKRNRGQQIPHEMKQRWHICLNNKPTVNYWQISNTEAETKEQLNEQLSLFDEPIKG